MTNLSKYFVLRSQCHSHLQQNFRLDFDKKTLEVKGVFPELVQKSHYKMDGKILLLPIRGEGPSTIVLSKFYQQNNLVKATIFFYFRKSENCVSVKL